MPFFPGQSREQLRQFYVAAWRKHRAGEPLAPLDAEIARVIAEHPEYQALLEAPEVAIEADFPPEAGRDNPFLHLGLHLAVREQVSTDRPVGIAGMHRRLSGRFGSGHAAEHQLLEALAETLWEAGRSGKPPDESAYLERLERLLSDRGDTA
jgi:hypothetical protein